MSTNGASVYLSASEIEALDNAQSYLSALLEAASSEATNLIETKAGLASIIQKAGKAQRSTRRRSTVKVALRAAQDN